MRRGNWLHWIWWSWWWNIRFWNCSSSLLPMESRVSHFPPGPDSQIGENANWHLECMYIYVTSFRICKCNWRCGECTFNSSFKYLHGSAGQVLGDSWSQIWSHLSYIDVHGFLRPKVSPQWLFLKIHSFFCVFSLTFYCSLWELEAKPSQVQV